jgi:hypothetical protein
VHLGIALFLGMPTFGLAMIIANLAFVYPETVEAIVNLRWLKGQPEVADESAPKVSLGTQRKGRVAGGDAADGASGKVRNQLI